MVYTRRGLGAGSVSPPKLAVSQTFRTGPLATSAEKAVTKYFLEYSVGGVFVDVPDDLGAQLVRDQRTVRRLETGATIDAYWEGKRIRVRMQKLSR